MYVNNRFYIFIILVTLCFYSKAQVYKAGDNLSGYVDINPDTLINFNYPNSLTESYYFDINNDSQNDYKIESYNSGGLGGASRFIVVMPVNVNAFIKAGRIDSVYHGFYQYWLTTPIVKPLNYGDSINSLVFSWKSQNLYLTNNSGSAGTYVNPTDWIGSTDLYIGLKYQTITDTIYGWIRVNCPFSNKCYVKDFSSMGFYTRIKENEVITERFIVYPNPAINLLHISYENNTLDNSIIEITNYLGQTIIKQAYSNLIDVSKLTTGLYTLKINVLGKQSFYSKFVKE